MKIPNKVTLIDKRKMSNIEWQAMRSSYIGGSDMGTLMGLNAFESALELFHRKVGVISSSKPESLSTYSGHTMESVIYESYWRFYDPENPTDERLVENAVAGRVMRTARRKNFTMISKEFPWLGANLDYIIDENKFTPPGILDCKNSLTWVSNQYESNVNPVYVIQKQDYMLVTGFDYSELAYLLDGRYPRVFPIPAERSIQEHIVRMSKEFWLTVLEGRKIWNDTSMSEEERLQELSTIEPQVDSSEALEGYLKDRFKKSKKNGQMVITDEILEVGRNYLACNEQLNTIEDDKRLQGNLIRKLFLDSGIDEIVDSKNKVLISYRAPEGKSPVLRVGKELLKM